ncbi:hypothetical protein GCM10009765_83670 [Fodinicola feengrottensis]|uniref:DNRLRE domain-containing protein n=1 Tax=Fodinicola feengrottensis TaxID=435914 RepID=A0ABN2JD32_9ACTN
MVLTFLLTFSADPATAFASPTGGPLLPLPSFSLSAALTWLTGGPVAKWGNLPVQPTGTAAGKSHLVPASATKANRGTGRPPGHGKGELPAYSPLAKKTPVGPSGHGPGRFDAKTSKRVATKSTATSTYFQNADGSYTRRLSEQPTNYKDSSGAWQAIDTGLTSVDGRWKEKANSLALDFAGSATDPNLVRFGLDNSLTAGRGISYGLQGATAVAPAIAGSTATYPGVLPDTDLQVHPTNSGVKESVILHSATAANSWVFPLKLRGLTASQQADGSISLTDSTGKPAGRIPAPYAYDSKVDPSSGDPATTRAVTSKLTTAADGQQTIETTLDATWLKSPQRVFPVTVDPSTGGLYPVVTTYADTDTPTVDHSGDPTLKVGTFDGSYKANSFIKLDTAGLDGSHVTVSSAILHVFDSWAFTCTPERFDVAQVTVQWTGSSAGAYPGPSVGGSIGSATPSVPNACANTTADRSKGDWVSVPVSSSVMTSWAASSSPDAGLSLYASTADHVHWKQFDSDNNSDNYPYMDLTYNGAMLPQIYDSNPPNGTTSTTQTPVLSATGNYDVEAAPSQKFQFTVFDTNGTKVADSGLQTANYWTIPAGRLAWGRPVTGWCRILTAPTIPPAGISIP